MCYKGIILLYFFIADISGFNLLAQHPPKVEAKVGISGSCVIKSEDFSAQLGVRGFIWVNTIHAEPITIDSFTLTITRDSFLLYTSKNKGPEFEQSSKQLFKELKNGDRILIYDIYTTLPGGKKWLINPLEYIIE